MEFIKNNQLYQNDVIKLILSGLLAGLFLYLFSYWVPFSDGFYYEWRQGNLFQEMQPRALMGTLANVLHFGDRGFGFIKLGALWVWLTLIINKLSQSLQKPIATQPIYALICISFLFAFSTVAQMTFGPVMFVDVISYLFVLLVYLNLASDKTASISDYCINSLLLVAAVANHEKSIFDIGILLLWLLYKRGFKKSVFALGPGLVLCAAFLLMLRSKKLTGETLDTYVSTLDRGADFLGYSFNLPEVLIGLGSLGVLYLYLAIRFVSMRRSAADGVWRLVLVLAMFMACIAPLSVAWDTNRLVGLIWLPALILLGELGPTIYSSPSRLLMVFMGLLCLLQLALPPILRFPPNVVIAYNSYAKNIYGDRAVSIGTPIRRGELLMFNDRAKGSSSLKSGWGGPESWGVWSNQPSALIKLENLDPEIKKAQVRFNTLISASHPTQEVAIFANNQLVGKNTISSFNDNVITVDIPKIDYRSLELKFVVDQVRSPAQLGIAPDDQRMMGIGLVSMTFQ